MAYCRHCGAPIADGTITCPQCGASQSSLPPGGRQWRPWMGDPGLLYPHCRPGAVAGLEGPEAPDSQGRRHWSTGRCGPWRAVLCADIHAWDRDRPGQLKCWTGLTSGCQFCLAATNGQTAPFTSTEDSSQSVPGVPVSLQASWLVDSPLPSAPWLEARPALACPTGAGRRTSGADPL